MRWLGQYLKSSPAKRIRTPVILEMESSESGPACLASVLAYYDYYAPIEEVRRECGVTRDGTKTSYILRAAEKYGLAGREVKCDPADLKKLDRPAVVFLNFKQFAIYEGYGENRVFLNDPETGPRAMPESEFNEAFTGVTLLFEPGPKFKPGGEKPNLFKSLCARLAGTEVALTYVFIAGLFLVIPGLIIPVFSKVFVDDILVNSMKSWLGPLLLGMGLTALLRAGLTWLQKYYLLRLETRQAISASARFFHHVFRLPVDYFYQRFGGEIVNRVQINDRVAHLLSGDLAANLLNVVMIVFYAAIMFQYDIFLTLTGLFIIVINLAALRHFSMRRTTLIQRLMQDQGKSLSAAISGLQMIETLKAGGAESEFFGEWAGHQARVKNAEQELGVASQILSLIPPFLSDMNTLIILSVGAVKIMHGNMSMGSLIAFQSLMASFVGPVNEMVNLGNKLQEVRADMNRLDDVMRNSTDELFAAEEKEYAPELALATKLEGRIELKNLTFGYNKLEAPLIENFSLVMEPGSRVALVGSSGSGKSTVAKLVTGLYTPWGGEILFDGRRRAALPRRLLVNSVAMVDQEIFMFEGTVRDNLSIWDKTISEPRIIRAAMDACIHDDITERTGGYDSRINEGCTNFSGGQRQRLEIARALVNDPSVLVLDEATSALDPNTEKKIDDHLRRRGCTCLIIAHRLSTIRDCDEIIVLERGKVVQRGTHEEMKKVNGPYARLIKAE